MKKLLLSLLAIVWALAGFAQNRTIHGKVLDDADGTTLVGVNIKIKGTALGTSTDTKGNFSIALSEGQKILVVSYIGYKMLEVPVSTQSTLNVRLVPDSKALDDVVVVGYGVVRKKD